MNTRFDGTPLLKITGNVSDWKRFTKSRKTESLIKVFTQMHSVFAAIFNSIFGLVSLQRAILSNGVFDVSHSSTKRIKLLSVAFINRDCFGRKYSLHDAIVTRY